MTNAPMSPDEWRALTPREKRTAWRLWSHAERGAMVDQFAATTPKWGLPYPENYNDPADSPSAFRALAQASDTALTTLESSRMPVAVTTAAIASQSGWTGGVAPTANRTGNLVILSGAFFRSATINITDNEIIRIGTIPAGYFPKVTERTGAPCIIRISGKINYTMGHLLISAADGAISFVATATGTMNANDWVTMGGMAYVGSG